MKMDKIFQISTLQALILGYFRKVATVEEFLTHGDTGLGTFEHINGEMIVLDGECYRALEDGKVEKAEASSGIPFGAVATLEGAKEIKLSKIENIKALTDTLNIKIEEDFGLNSIHVARIDGVFEIIKARSESPYASHHVELKEVLKKTQKEFKFEKTEGSLVCLYFPDYMDGINAPGWHLHYVSKDKTVGGHVFDLSFESATLILKKLSGIEIKLPSEPAFDTYALKTALQSDIKKIEQSE